jgi:hypothetical protein
VAVAVAAPNQVVVPALVVVEDKQELTVQVV